MPVPHLRFSGVHIDVPTREVDAIVAAFARVGWNAVDTGRTVATDEDEEALTTLFVDVPLTPTPSEAAAHRAPAPAPPPAPAPMAPPPIRVAPPPPPPPPPPTAPSASVVMDSRSNALPWPVPGESAQAPAPTRSDANARGPAARELRGIVHVDGDLHIGDGVRTDVSFTATGRVTVGREAHVAGFVRSEKGMTLQSGATVGDAFTAGDVTLMESAVVANLLQAEGGVKGPGEAAWRRRPLPE